MALGVEDQTGPILYFLGPDRSCTNFIGPDRTDLFPKKSESIIRKIIYCESVWYKLRTGPDRIDVGPDRCNIKSEVLSVRLL